MPCYDGMKKTESQFIRSVVEGTYMNYKHFWARWLFQGLTKLRILVCFLVKTYMSNSNVTCIALYFLYNFLTLLIWIEIAVMFWWPKFLDTQILNLTYILRALFFWDLYQKFLKTSKISGLLCSMLSICPHSCATHNLCDLYPH